MLQDCHEPVFGVSAHSPALQIGIQKLSVAPVTLNCLDHLALLVLAKLPGVLQGLGAPTHMQISKTSAVL